MESTLDFLTEEQRKLHEEFTQCQNWDEVEAFLKKVEKLKESRENNEIPHLDMTLEEFDAPDFDTFWEKSRNLLIFS